MGTREHGTGGRVSRAVNVLVYDLGNGSFMAAVLEKKWAGATRLDRRLARTQRLLDDAECPPGVVPEVWLAYKALHQVVQGQALAHSIGLRDS
jgi:hypothetical protein